MNPLKRATLIVLLTTLACAAPISLPPILQDEPTGAPPPTESPPDPDPTSPPPSDADFPAAGTLAIVGIDGNLYTATRADGVPPFTTDAEIGPQDEGRLAYSHPTWSPDGWLSYVQIDTTGRTPFLSVLAEHPDLDAPLELLRTTRSDYIYGYWSPAPCAAGAGCGQLAYLMSGASDIDMHLATVATDAGGASDEILDNAGPFYYSWSPDGRSMLWHQSNRRLLTYDASSGEIGQALPDLPGVFQAPAWSPVDDRWLFAVNDEGWTTLTIAEAEQRRSLSDRIDGPIYFGWSPDGARIAHASGTYPLGDLTLVDVEADRATEIDGVGDVLAFFWSPDSTRLAVVTIDDFRPPLPEARAGRRAKPILQDSPPDVILTWWIVDAATGEATKRDQFLPTPQQFYILQFFDQYAQSHRVWSPDSRYIAYANVPLGTGAPQIVLMDAVDLGVQSTVVMDGVQAIFSFGE